MITRYKLITSKYGPSCRARKSIQNHITEPNVAAKITFDLAGFGKKSGLLNFSENIVNDQKALHPDVPLIMMGDFNGLARKDECQFEFDDIHYNDFINIIELNPDSVQHSHFGFLKNGQKNYIQLDYIFVESKYVEKFDLNNTKIDNISFNPNSYEERRRLPSDHLPIICTLKKA